MGIIIWYDLNWTTASICFHKANGPFCKSDATEKSIRDHILLKRLHLLPLNFVGKYLMNCVKWQFLFVITILLEPHYFKMFKHIYLYFLKYKSIHLREVYSLSLKVRWMNDTKIEFLLYLIWSYYLFKYWASYRLTFTILMIINGRKTIWESIKFNGFKNRSASNFLMCLLPLNNTKSFSSNFV